MRTITILAAAALLAGSPAARGAEEEHPIDQAEKACMDKNGSTAGMTRCADEAYASWDKELNANFSALMQELSGKDKETLRAAQRKWIDFRDGEFRLIDAVYGRLQGTMYLPMRVDARVRVVRERAVKLSDLLDLLKEGQ